MVQWKGNITEEAGRKALMLDSVESLEVPNFFVLTPEETGAIAVEGKDVSNSELPDEIAERIEEAYDEIGMSSEVRGASDEARELVGGQRETQRVSVRVSASGKGAYESRLDIVSSSIIEAVREVLASYHRKEKTEGSPPVIVQKMVDPELTGAAYIDYLGNKQLLEAVPGLGIPLEEGLTVPELYLIRENDIEVRIPSEQVEVSRNPMNGEYRRQKVKRNGRSFDEAELREFFERLQDENLNVKFAYKRGTFYIVDAFRAEKKESEVSRPSLDGVRVSTGEIKGTVGREISLEDQPLMPENYREALVAKKGGYSSTAAQRAREAGKAAIFSFSGEIERGQQLSLGPLETNLGSSVREEETGQKASRQRVTGSEVLPLNSGEGLYTRPPFTGKYAVTDRPAEGVRIPESGYLSSYRDVFSFDGERAVLDARYLSGDALEPAVEYIDADLKALILDEPDSKVIRAAVENGFTVFAVETGLEELAKTVEREERRFILEKLRE